MGGYMACMFIYFSEDKFERSVRDFVRKIGYLFVWWFPVTVVVFSVFGGLSYQIPDWAQLPYWLSVFAVFSFYLIWTIEGTTGRKILGKRSIFDKPTEAFLEVSREGAQVIADTLVHLWKGIMVKLFRRPITTKISTRRTTWIFVIIIESIAISNAYFVLNVSGLNLLYAFGVPLYLLLFVSAIVGWYKKRKRKSSSNSAASTA
jgi:hypothetical protein